MHGEKRMDFDKLWKNRIAFQCSCCFTNYTFDEMMNTRSVWVNDDEKYGKVSICHKCGKKFLQDKWQIKSYKDIYVVYTTHLEMPQIPPNFHENLMDTLYFWETMIQNIQNDQFLNFQARYQSQEEAELGHWLAYDKLEDMLLYPDKYPQGLMPLFIDAIDQAKTIERLYSEEAKGKFR